MRGQPLEQGADIVGALLDGRYRVAEVLARGGTSTVYRGVDTRLDRPVAVKVMDPAFAVDPVFLHRFEREARAAARLHHPGIVGVYDQGVDIDGDRRRVFLVMELVEGGTLRDLLRERGSLSVPLALAVVEQVSAALAVAHRAGLVHRDVKPENVLIGPGGAVKVADFGLVRAVAEANSGTGDVILGTVAYLSPEQVATGAANANSDVYATGVLLYELLTGAPPYTGETALSVAYQHVNRDVPAPSEAGITIPPALDELVLAATRRDADARPTDAAALLDALRRVRVAANIPTVAVPVPGEDTVRFDAVDTPGRPRVRPGAPGVSPAGPGGTRALIRGPGIPGPAHDRFGTSTVMRPVGPGPDTWTRERRRNRRAFTAWVTVVVLLAAAVGVCAWWLGSGRWASVPELTGLDRAAVEQALTDADLRVRITEDHHDTVADGLSISADPAPGARALRGSEVGVVFSLGRPSVPDIEPGTELADVEDQLRGADLEPVRDEGADRFDDTVAAGGVLELRPAAGTVLTVGAPVTVIVSRGAAPVDTPDVQGLPEDDALAVLRQAGLRPTVERRFDPEVAAGAVISTDPEAGEENSRGSQITVLVNNGVAVPDVVGRPWPEASRVLTDAGLVPEQTGEGVGRDGTTVRRLDPGVGSVVRPGSRVRVETTTDVTVPDVQGRTVAEARGILEAAGLRVEVRQIFGDENSPVRRQSPDAGDTVRPGTRVRLSTF